VISSCDYNEDFSSCDVMTIDDALALSTVWQFPFVPRTVVNTGKHYFCVRVIEPWNNLNCTTVDFSSLRRFRRFLRRTD